ncbi:hypothetical protein SY83_12220 [Paenibacillus swuensis]|uniref:Sucrose phosphatase-like domain-containing protein n=1 Tax=Paenibacillus swuensis TaxID=1178515 RepID=A0A172TIN2_9BACL|nr:HAD family hydrolase [Paenibacillus swuensis]ANE46915.1 hypothetical protein SY83_12220 [Paenibacillus swuensis]
MIFASDLDQTLIYSVRSKGDTPLESMVPVELYEGRHISYMTPGAIEKLHLLKQWAHFVPVTTRTPEQYLRIFGIRERFQPAYVIVSNGGTVLHEGTPDRVWNEMIRKAVGNDCAHASEIQELFQQIAEPHWVKSSTLCDELFYSIVVERDQVPASMDEWKKQLTTLGWSYSLQGRKIYLVPERVSKGAALAYVKEKLGSTYVMAAGDSLLDESLLLVADQAIAPAHGELRRAYAAHSHIQFTQQAGAAASEELLDRFIQEAERRAVYIR